MRSVFETALDCVAGAVDVAADPAGVTFHRSPRRGRERLGDPVFDLFSAMPSGVRLEALTDAGAVELDVELTRALPPGMASPGSVFDLVVDGVPHEPVTTQTETLLFWDLNTADRDVRPGGTATVRFEPGAAGRERRIEIWFPSSARMKLLDVRVPDGATLRPAPAGGPLWVHHGSSISQCAEADRPTGTWPALVARAAGRSLVNLAIGGQCHLDPFMARAVRDLPATAISLELGINILNADTMRERTFVPAFHGFLDTVREGHPETPVAVITPILCPAAERRPGPTFPGPDLRTRTVDRPDELALGALTLSRIRELLHEHVGVRREEGDRHLHVVDGLALFGEDDVDHLPDGLHPDAEGYARMAGRFLPLAFGTDGPFGSAPADRR
jgi:hypothetical protein